MDEVRQALIGLAPQDRAYLARARNLLKKQLVAGWFMIACSLCGGALLLTNFNRIFPALAGVRLSVVEAFHAENARLRTLQTTTPTEEGLVKRLIEKNSLLATTYQQAFAAATLIAVGVLCGGLLSHGLTMLAVVYVHRRYLRIIDAVERTIQSF